MQEIALGQLGFTEAEFWDMTPRALMNAIHGHQRQRREMMELIRLQTLYSVNVWVKPQITDPKRLWRYGWERERMTKEEVEKIRQRGLMLAAKMKRHGRK